MDTIILYTEERPVDYTGNRYYLDNKSEFCPRCYATWAGIDPSLIDLDSVKSVIDAANNLPDWNTLEVKHFYQKHG